MAEDRAALLKEAYDRGILPPAQKAAYEEAQRRGLLPQAKEPTSAGEGGFFSTFAHGLVKGFSGAASAAGEAAAIEMGQPEMQGTMPTAAQATDIVQKEVTGPLPVMPGSTGKVVEAVGEALGNPSTYVAPGSWALKVGGGALSAAGGESAAQALEGTGLEAYENWARLGGSLFSGLGVSTASMERQLKKLGERLPEREGIKLLASAGYKQLEQSKTQLNPEGASQLASEILDHLEQTNHRPYIPDHKAVFDVVEKDLLGIGRSAARAEQRVVQRGEAAVGALSSESTSAEIAAAQRAQQATAGVTTSVGEIDTVRKVLTGLAGKSIQPATREAAGEAIDAIDAFLMNVPERFVVSGNPRADAELLRRTQQLWSTQKQMETVEKATTAAQRRAGSTGTGANRINAARQELRKIIDSEKKSRGMPQAVKDKIDQIVVGTRMSNALRNVSKWAPTGPVSTATGVGTSYLTGGWLLAVTTAAAGWIAKHAGEYLTDRQIRQLTEMMRAGNPLGAPIAREIAPLQAQARRTPALYGGYQGMQALTSGPLGPGTSP